jgi:hypothetical protein
MESRVNDWQELTEYKGYAIVMRWREEPARWDVEWAVGKFVGHDFTPALPVTTIAFSKMESSPFNCFLAIPKDAKRAIDQCL